MDTDSIEYFTVLSNRNLELDRENTRYQIQVHPFDHIKIEDKYGYSY